MTVLAAEGKVHNFELGACEGSLGANVGIEEEELAEKSGGLFAFFFVFAVDTNVNDFKAVHESNCFFRELFDFVEFTFVYQGILNHEAAAACKDLGVLEVGEDVVLVDAAGGHELELGVRTGNGFDHVETADCFCGEELNDVKTELHCLFHFAAGGTAGAYGNAFFYAVFNDLRIESGRNDELGACRNCLVNLFGGEDGTCTYEHVGHCFGDVLDCLCRSSGTERNFCEGKTAVCECFCERNCFVRVFNFDNGHDAVIADLF